MGKLPVHVFQKGGDTREIRRLSAVRDRLRKDRDSALVCGLLCVVLGGLWMILGGSLAVGRVGSVAAAVGLGCGLMALVFHLGMWWAHRRMLARMDELEEVS